VTFAVGSLVRSRGREWVVLPDSTDDTLILKPLGGTDDEVTGIYLPLETVEPASFGLPDPERPGDYISCRLLRDALRLGFRSSAGPFRCFARIAVEPRPYQLVPLLMALRLDPVRLLIADDVGVGKTIEACLVARELIDRGESSRLVVLCPPQLAEQWQGELSTKFHIEAELVLPSTVSALERHCRLGQSLFDVFDYLVVSTDFIKSDRLRQDFLRACPDLVIVDEAHTCAYTEYQRGGRHQRYQLLRGLAQDPNRHLILVTATPHSGKEEAFRSLLSFLDPEFARLPNDLAGEENLHYRRRLAAHFVQRRRGDIRHYLQKETDFPEREEKEDSYQLSPDYRILFDRVLAYASETIRVPGESRFRQRVRWWSALALLRSLGSSPAAAAATLRERARVADAKSVEEADDVGRRTVMDQVEDESAEGIDVIPGSDAVDEPGVDTAERRRLLAMARQADALQGDKDSKLLRAAELIQSLVDDGFKPIVFCRFIPTAEYVAAELRRRLRRGIEIAAVTGHLPPAEREQRILQLARSPQRVLVCTDCLSEGINLQEHFDAVFHYDLTWNPTRHEQREGRVDRYGQPSPKVRVLTYFGTDNRIDGIVLNVLLRKHNRIRSALGISVPVPVDTQEVIEAIVEGLLLRHGGRPAEQLSLFEGHFRQKRDTLHAEWDAIVDRERRSRTIFAQESIKFDEVARELEVAQKAAGSGIDVASFTTLAAELNRGMVTRNGAFKFDLRESPRALRDAIGGLQEFTARFELPVKEGQIYLTRTHPIVEGLATHILDTALDPQADGVARRSGAMRTRAVQRRTTLLLCRYRYHVVTIRDGRESELLAEDCRLLAFAGSPENAEWLEDEAAEKLLEAEPAANIAPDLAKDFVRRVVEGFASIEPHIHEDARRKAGALLDAHRRVRAAARMQRVSYRVVPQLPPDVLGIFVLLPVAPGV